MIELKTQMYDNLNSGVLAPILNIPVIGSLLKYGFAALKYMGFGQLVKALEGEVSPVMHYYSDEFDFHLADGFVLKSGEFNLVEPKYMFIPPQGKPSVKDVLKQVTQIAGDPAAALKILAWTASTAAVTNEGATIAAGVAGRPLYNKAGNIDYVISKDYFINFGVINDGVFKSSGDNYGVINGGDFKAAVHNKQGGVILGGEFEAGIIDEGGKVEIAYENSQIDIPFNDTLLLANTSNLMGLNAAQMALSNLEYAYIL